MKALVTPTFAFFLTIGFQAHAAEGDLRAFILAGQSNMDGRPQASLLPESLQRPQKDVMFFWKDSWGDLTYGSTFSPSRPRTTFGPEITFGRAMADAWPSDRIAIIKHAKGGTGLVVEWKPRTGPHYVMLMEKVTKARQLLAARGQKLKIEGVVWMQGEFDTREKEIAAAYGKNLTEFIRIVREDLGDPNLPFVFGQIHAPTHYYPFREPVKEGQAHVAKSVQGVAMVTTTHLELMDDVHYTAEGVMWLGRKFAEEMRRLIAAQPARRN